MQEQPECRFCMPMPPSENALYRNVPRVGRVKTAEYKRFERTIRDWHLANMRWIVAHTKLLNLSDSSRLHVESVFHFPKERLFCKDGRVKRLDTSNRVKALHDTIAKVFAFDDRYIWSFRSEKTGGVVEEYVEVTLRLIARPSGDRPDPVGDRQSEAQSSSSSNSHCTREVF